MPDIEPKVYVEPQIYTVDLTPRQRLLLFNLLNHNVAYLEGREIQKKFTRLNRALGLHVVKEAIRKNTKPDGSCTIYVGDTRSAFTLTHENVSFLLDVAMEKVSLSPEQLQILDPFFESLENARQGLAVAKAEGPVWDEATDEASWMPKV